MASTQLGSKQTPPAPADFVAQGRVVTMNARREIIPDGAVAVRDGNILAVGDREEILRRFAPSRVLGDRHAIVIPGLIEGHTHCTQAFVRSLTAGELPMIPRIYNPGQRCLTPDQAGATVRLIAAQLLRSGVTTLCEGTLNPAHEEAIVSALHEVGIRCCMARGAADQDFYHAALYAQLKERSWAKPRPGEAERELSCTEAFLRRFPPKGHGLIRGAVNVSALLGFSEAYFRGGAALARYFDTTLQVHVGRDREEVEFCLAVWGRRPIERLADLGVIDDHLIAVHAVLASEGEIELLAQGKACLSHSPIECVANLNAIPNLQRFRKRGIKVSLGCDNQGNDMFVNMRAAWVIHGAKWGLPAYDPDYLDAGEIFSMATSESAEVLRWDDRIGSLQAGKAADLVVLDGSGPHLMAMQHLPSELVRFASRAEVRQTMVNGRLLYDLGAFPTVDLERLRAEATAGASLVRAEVADRRYRPLPCC